MVNNTIVSYYIGTLPGVGEVRSISNGPLYPASDVLTLLDDAGSKAIRTWTRKCTADIQKWNLDAEDLCELISMAVRTGRFTGAEWCQQNHDGPWAACDAYTLVRREWLRAGIERDIEYYIKFAISVTGTVLLIVSCHPSEDRRER